MEDSRKTFADLGLKPEIVEALTGLGYEAPTPIQERTIPLLLASRDLIGQAQTGTGKTAAFALPILQKIDPKRKETQALVLAPTRELAMQVAEAIHSYSTKLGQAVNVLPVYGGAPIVPQLKRLERGAHVVVGTPGRLIDHLDRGSLNLSGVSMLVLDEADEMLKMGFAEEVDRILAAVPAERQVALFSATMPEEVLRIAKRHLRNPERVEIEHKSVAAPAIEQRFLNLSEGQKLEVLTQILELESSEGVLIFRRTKTGSAELAEKLEARGFSAVAMHGDMSQPLRESVIRRLRNGQVEIVVATDVAARGLDVEQITHVINYDVPYDVEAYVHRIGRTGRAGRTGVATMFITPRERRMMREIERYTGTPIKPMKMPSRADIAAKRVTVFKDSVRKTIQEGDLDLYLELVEQLVEEGPFDIADVAAAAARLANSSRSLQRTREDDMPEVAAPAAREPGAERAPRAPREDRGDADGKTVTLSMSVGKNDGIRPADVVGSIANEADVPGRDIGPIEIRDDITFVGIPQNYVDVVIEKVGRKKFRGRPLNVRVATEKDLHGAPARARKPYGSDRPSFAPAKRYADREGAPPRKSYAADREAGAPPRKTYAADREGAPVRKPYGAGREGAPPRKSYAADREGAPPRKAYSGDREGAPPRKAYAGDRESAPRKPYGAAREGAPARKPYGARSDSGAPPRKSFGAKRDAAGPARKPFGAAPRGRADREGAAPRGPKPFWEGRGGKKKPR